MRVLFTLLHVEATEEDSHLSRKLTLGNSTWRTNQEIEEESDDREECGEEDAKDLEEE